LGPACALFSESNARLIVSVAAEHAQDFEATLRGQMCQRIGEVTRAPRLEITVAKLRLELDLDALNAAFSVGGA
jgi:phosphoribosylformylglycinamidine (FGAM) synthase-like enzyme